VHPGRLAPDARGQLEQLARRNFVYVGCTVRRDALARTGGFDESMRGCEDWLAWLKVLSDGYRLTLVEEPLAAYRNSDRQAHRDRKRMSDGQRTLDEWLASVGCPPSAQLRIGADHGLVGVLRALTPAPIRAKRAFRPQPPEQLRADFPALWSK
jgi:hypothetical protein